MGMHIGTPVSGGTHTTYETYGIKSFTSSGTFITKVPLLIDILIVAGGGPGGGTSGAPGGSSGWSGGGGAGGYRAIESASIAPGSYTVTVGAGGAVDSSGANSVFGNFTSTGGGKGGVYATVGTTGGSGGGVPRMLIKLHLPRSTGDVRLA